MSEILDRIMGQVSAIARRVAHLETLEGGGGGVGGPHEVLSATHSDTAADTVVQGDLITGQGANPVWQRLAAGDPGDILTMGADEPGWASGGHTHTRPRSIVFEFVGTLSLATGTIRIYPDGTWVIDKVWPSVSVAPTGANVIVDVHKNGTTIFTDQGKRPQIAAGAYTDESDTPDVTALTKTDYLTMDVDQVGSTITGQDLTVHVRATETL